MKVILMIERILMLSWIQWAMIQVIDRYETNGGFLVFVSVKSLIQVSKQIEP